MEEDTSQPDSIPAKPSPSTAMPAMQTSNIKDSTKSVITESESLLSMTEVDALPTVIRYTWFDLICTLVSIITYVADLVMDIVVAVYFYHLGVTHGIYHYWYFGLTVTFILLPSLTMTGFSFRWYLQDADDSKSPPVPIWRWVVRLLVLMLQVAPLLRYIDSIYYGMRCWYWLKVEQRAKTTQEKKTAKENSLKSYTLMVYEEADGALLRLFECFMESAPQLVLQIYILLRDPHAIPITERTLVEDEKVEKILQNTILAVSVLSSLVSLAWSLVVYHRSLRYSNQNKKNINLAGSLCQFLWHFFSITARVLALSLFASIYPLWIGPVIALHWAIMSVWLLFQQTQACHNRFAEFLFNLVIGVIYIFSFFNAKDEPTRKKYLIFYTFCFMENTILIVFWFLYANSNLGIGQTHWYWIPGIIGHYAMFFAGIFFMLLYYGAFHPTKIDPPKPIRNLWLYLRRLPQSKKSNTPREAQNDIEEPPVKSQILDLQELKPSQHSGSVRSLSRSTPSQLDELDASGSIHKPTVRSHNPVLKTTSLPTPVPCTFADVRTLKSLQRS